MALREGTRRWAMRLAWASLLVASSLLVGLRTGRPLHYTDGSRELDGRELANAGMLQWDTPEADAEVPGPVAGRIAALSDGRLLYGRLGEDGTADLVTWDPARPAVPPEPVYGLNTPHNEVAPAVGPDGRIYFASDRPDGAGGYDLYVAPRLQAGAGEVQPLPATRTALDETDPAPHGNGVDFVFVRSDRRSDGGNDGTLWRWRLGDELDPAPLFGPPARVGVRPVDRDPVFSADGASLWFVRKLPGQRLALRRASLHLGSFDEPLAVGEAWGTGELRSPLPAADGRRLALLRPRGGERPADLWYTSHGREVYPWWPGQRWLEWLLLGVAGISALLLVLLHFGRRWSTLDLVAQCLLLSLLLHFLLFLWLMGVEIAGSLLPGNDEAGGFEVNVVAAHEMAAAGGGAASEVGAMVQFTPNERSLAAAAPDTSPLRTDARAQVDAGAATWERDLTARDVAATAALADAPAPAPARDGRDAPAPVAAATLGELDAAPASAAAAPRNARAAAGPGAVAVQVPASGLPRADAAATLAAAPPPPAALAVPVPAAAVDVAAPALQDEAAGGSAAAVVAHAGDDAPAAAPALAAAAANPVAPAAPASPGARFTDAALPAKETVVAPGSGLVRAGRPAPAAPAPVAALAAPAPQRGRTAGAASLREDTSAAAAAAAAATAKATPPAAASSASGAAAQGLRPLDTPSAAPLASGAAIAPQRSAAAGSTAGSDLPRPSSALARPSRQVGARPAASPVASGAPRALASPAAVRPRDAGTAPAAAARAAPATAARPQPEIAAIALRSSAPAATTLDRPQRASESGGFAASPLAVAPPASRLLRAPPAAASVPEAALPPAQVTAYSNRFGPAKAKALEQFGGTDATERAVANGLRYLAKIQNEDGSWGDRSDYDAKYGLVYVGKTALCVLAFLGAGHTPQSGTEHSKVVARAVTHLLALQDEQGAFGPSSCYGHGISTYALAECYGITRAAQLRAPLERALTWILDNQGPRRDRRNRGGWGYFAPGLQAEDDFARVSVSSWMIMALESARLSGIELPTEVLPAAREYLELCFDQPNGWFRYNHKPSRVNSAWPTLPASTPAAAFCLQLLGAGTGDAKVRAGLAFTVERRPEQYRRYADDDFVLRGQGNVYFWYYGTLACFLAGGDAWKAWNERLRTVLPAAQSRDGSFPPIDVYAEEAGDNRRDHSYTTAMCVLCLEVYYRYFTPLLLGR